MTTVEPVMRFPGNGFMNAQGLYQFERFLVFEAQLTELTSEGLGDVKVPPVANGPLTLMARVPLPLGDLMPEGYTVNGLPLCAVKVASADQPPINSFISPFWLKNRCPIPKGN